MRLLKKVKRRNKKEKSHSSRTTKEKGSIILDMDENTQCLMMKER